MPRVPRRVLAACTVAAAAVAVSACVGAASTTAQSARRAQAEGISNSAEVVLGTLVAPPSRRFLARVRSGKMGGVILLGNGWLTRSTAAAVTAKLQRAACTRGEPLLIAVDQEGGMVRRLAWAPPTEAPAEISSPAVAHAQAAG